MGDTLPCRAARLHRRSNGVLAKLGAWAVRARWQRSCA